MIPVDRCSDALHDGRNSLSVSTLLDASFCFIETHVGVADTDNEQRLADSRHLYLMKKTICDCIKSYPPLKTMFLSLRRRRKVNRRRYMDVCRRA